MRLWKSWIVAKKDLAVLKRRRTLMASIIAVPVLLGTALPVLVLYVAVRKSAPPSVVTELLASFSFFFIIISALLTLYISSYGIVGEKIERSLEPLLATPTSDGEILVGKYISSFLPMILSIYVGLALFMILADVMTSHVLGYAFYPNWNIGIILFIGVPLAIMYGTSFGIFISAKANNVQTAYQIGAASLIPFYILYIMGEVNLVSLTTNTNLLIISLGILIAVVIVYYLSKATFNRERILTEWK